MSNEPLSIRLAESGHLPDVVVRFGIRRLLRQRIRQLDAGGSEASSERETRFVAALRVAPIAMHTAAANAQHYEVPADFFGLMLGPQRKYSCCWWPPGTTSLAEAESAALTVTCERAQLADGQRILELGCGWGSLSLWMAAQYPHARITGVSNSASQRAYILATAAARGLRNLDIITADLTDFHVAPAGFDRVVSVECFEHLRNWPELLRRIATWLVPGGRLFVHVFTHARSSYAFADEDGSDWMSRHFFTGGMMPADSLLPRFQDDLRLDAWWRWSGLHYARTAEAWLTNLDAQRPAALRVLGAARTDSPPTVQVQRWRMFCLACAELWRYRHGDEWPVSHYRMVRP